MRLAAHVPPSQGFTGPGSTGSDIAFTGNYAIMGNYFGFQTYDISDPPHPRLVVGYLCPTSQGDPTVYGHLLFVSGENPSNRTDCGSTPLTQDSTGASMERFRGIRIYDISDMAKPRLVKNLQTCRGSHTNTLVIDPRDRDNVYIYVSGYSSVRSDRELPGCKASNDPADMSSAQYRIDIIQVPVAHPEQARVINTPHVLADLSGRTVHAPPAADTVGRGAAAAARAGGAGNAGRAGGGRAGGGRAGRGGAIAPNPTPGVGQNGCHDITSYPAIGLAGGACSGYGLLFDITDAKNPRRIVAVSDSNMSFWHSATFSNNGDKVLFSDEWGGGNAPRCKSTDPLIWGGNAIFTLQNRKLAFQSYYKMPAAQTTEETCTAHNGSLIPIPGRDVMVQAFYQGGITVFDWTDAAHPMEIAFFDRGPSVGGSGGHWSAYWYNGYLYGNDEGRGIDVWELTPNAYLSQNEIDAAKSVKLTYSNAQEQQRFVWPATFALARAYLDQLERNTGLPAARIAAVRSGLANAESTSGSTRSSQLATLAASLSSDMSSARDRGRTQLLQRAIQDLAAK